MDESRHDMDPSELASSEIEGLLAEALGEVSITEVIRPSAIVPEGAARSIIAEMSLADVLREGVWHATPTLWERYDRPWNEAGDGSVLLGSLQVAYGVPTRYEITIYRATVTVEGRAHGWTVETLCDEALALGGLDLATCPRATLAAPPSVFKLQ